VGRKPFHEIEGEGVSVNNQKDDLKRRRILRLLLALLIGVVLILTSVRIVLLTAPLWVPLEYRMPGFPEDRYGFSLQERIYWSSIDLDFLSSGEGIEYFERFTLDDGSPMHNARELRHMADVKRLIVQVGRTWWVVGISTLLLTLTLHIRGEGTLMLEALTLGARWSLLLVCAVIVGVLLAFGVLFVGFHRIFFEGDTWLFQYSDTFIRLYPERFWRDTFILLALLNVIVAGGLYRLTRRRLSDRARKA